MNKVTEYLFPTVLAIGGLFLVYALYRYYENNQANNAINSQTVPSVVYGNNGLGTINVTSTPIVSQGNAGTTTTTTQNALPFVLLYSPSTAQQA